MSKLFTKFYTKLGSHLNRFLLVTLVWLCIGQPEVQAQTTVQIGTGTTISATTLYHPFYRFSATSTTTGSRADAVWTAAEMAAAGIPSGAQIIKVAFNKSNASNFTTPVASFAMYAANTANTSLATTLTWAGILGTHTPVYTPAANTFNVPLAAGWVDFVFSAPFTYTGGSFEIATEYTKGTTGSTDKIQWEYTSGFATSMVGNPSATATILSGTTVAYKERPNIKITYTSGACTSPPTAGASTATPSSGLCVGSNITLNLSGSSSGAGQTYQWESATTIGGTYTSVGSSSSSSTLITPATSTLYYRCAVTCGGNTQYSTPVLVSVNPPFPGGTYTINSGVATGGTNFQSFTDFKNALACGISGPIVVNVTGGTGPYIEQVEFGPIGGSSSTNTITVNGNGNVLSFAATVSTAPGTLILNGADYMNFNNLIISGTGATYALSCHLWNDANNNTFTSCTFNAPETGTVTTLSPFSLSGSATSATTAGLSGNNIVVSYCTMNGGYYSVAFSSSASSPFSGNQLNNCNLKNFYAYGAYNLNQNGTIISGNIIERPTRVGFTTFYGVYMSACSNVLAEKNKIRYPFETDYASTSTGYGFYLTGDASVGNENLIINNLVSDFNGGGTLYGIFSTGADYWKAFHNTFSFAQTASTTTSITYGIYSTGTLGYEVKNNIISITRGGTGIKYGLYYATHTIANSDNNNVYVNSLGGGNNYGYNGTAQASKLNWQTATSLDANSLDLDPTFVSPGTGDYSQGNGFIFDLGTPLGILTDINGTSRSTVNPDLGAYEVGGGDIVPPVVTFTNIPNTICTTDGNLLATIVDLTGVNNTTHLPRIWFKKSTENNAYNGNTSADNGWKYAEALNTNSPFQFSLPFGILNSALVAGDIIQYFITSEDTAPLPNVGIFSGSFPIGYVPTTVALDAGAFPIGGTIKSFTILPDPTTITSASSKETLCVSGDIVLSLSGDASTGAFYQWQSSPNGSSPWTDMAGATTSTYTVTGISATTHYRCEISCGDLVANGGTAITINNSTPVLVTVNNPTITGTVDGSRCGIGLVTLSATAAGTSNVNWYNASTGGSVLATGTSYSPSITATTTYYVSAVDGIGGAQTAVMPAQSTTFSGNVRGYWFTAPANFTITGVRVPLAGTGQSIAVVKFNGNTPPPTYSASTNAFTTLFLTQNNASTGTIPCNIAIQAGDVIGMLGQVGTLTSYGPATNPINVTIAGTAVPLQRMLMQFPLSTTAPQDLSQEVTATSQIGRVEFEYNQGCESARVPVLATVTSPDPLTIAGSGTIECNGTYAPISISSLPLSNYDSYIWTPTTDLYLDNVGTPYTGGSATTLYVKSTTAGVTTYTVNATNTISGCANVTSGSTTFLPGSSLAITGNADLCISGSRTLNLTPSAGITTGSVQWYMNGNPIGGANSPTYSTGTLTVTANYYAELVDGNANVCLTSPTATVLVNNPVITSTTPGSRCGTGTVNLSATATGANGTPSYNWYAASSGGSPLYSGPLNTFTTPVISSTTDFYVAASEGGGLNTTAGPATNGQTTGYTLQAGLLFDVFAPSMTLNGVYVYPIGTGAGVINVALKNAAGVVQQSLAYNVTATALPGVKTYIPLGWTVPAGTGWWLDMPSYSGAITSLIRDASANIVGGPIATNPSMTVPGVMTITSGRLTASGTSTSYYFFYDWQISTGCESARVPVTATVTAAPSITASATSTSTCIGNSIDLSVTSSNPDYSYTWSSVPTGYSASGAGPNSTIVNANSIVYNVTAVDNTAGAFAGCGAVSSVTVTAVSNPLTVTADATPSTICAGASSQLNTTATIPAVGYTMNSSCTTPFIDISTTGTSVGTVTDDSEHNISFPSFSFNGVPYTTARVGANGVIVFGSTAGEITTANVAIPTTAVAAGNNFLAPYWDDLDINMGGTIKTEQVGNIYIIQYTGMDHNSFTTGQITFQVQLDLSTGVISYVYPDVVFGSATYDNGLNATVGLQMSSTSAIQYSLNTASLTNGQSICFTPNPGIPTVTYNWNANPTLSATNIGNPMSNGATANETYTVTVTDVNGCTKSASTTLIVTPCNMTLNLNLWLEGYFDGTSAMGEVMLNQNYLPTPPAGDVDDITVELRELNLTTFEYDVIPNGSAVARLHTDGTASAVFSPAPANGSYYVVINHRNHLQTYSHDPVVIGSGTNSYNFKTAATQAAGSNMALLANSEYGLFSGDITQDGYVDSFDYGDFDTDSQNNVSGTYVATDLNGDGYVDSFDYGLLDTNTQNNVTVQFP